MPTSYSRTVGSSGMRLDVFLASQSEVGGRSHAKRLADGGHVTVDGRPGRAGQTLHAGQVVEFAVDTDMRDPLSPDLPLPEVAVLYEDRSLVVIDKPVGLAAHPSEDKSVVAHTVASWALARYGELPSAPEAPGRPGIVHRLDRDTSGVMVLAKTPVALEFLRAQFKARTPEKEYRCVVFGVPRFQSDWIDRPIASDPRHPDRMTVVDEGGRESSTYYEVVERFDGFAHVRCRPKTGRTHQIRVHMTAIGHSLVGDRVYRSRMRQHDRLPQGAPDPGRQCLHAMRLAIPHPETHERIEFEAPLPADMQALLEWLRANRAPRAR